MNCFAPGCKSGNHGSKTRLFRFPKRGNEHLRELWLQNMPNIIVNQWNFEKSRLCDLHFEDKFLIKNNVVTMNGAVMISHPRKNWALTADAVPTKFSFYYGPVFLNKSPNKRMAPTEKQFGTRQKHPRYFIHKTKLQGENEQESSDGPEPEISMNSNAEKSKMKVYPRSKVKRIESSPDTFRNESDDDNSMQIDTDEQITTESKILSPKPMEDAINISDDSNNTSGLNDTEEQNTIQSKNRNASEIENSNRTKPITSTDANMKRKESNPETDKNVSDDSTSRQIDPEEENIAKSKNPSDPVSSNRPKPRIGPKSRVKRKEIIPETDKDVNDDSTSNQIAPDEQNKAKDENPSDPANSNRAKPRIGPKSRVKRKERNTKSDSDVIVIDSSTNGQTDTTVANKIPTNVQTPVTSTSESDTGSDDEYEYKCDDCDKSFRHQGSLSKHRLFLHSGSASKRFKCEMCDKGFATFQNYNCHLLTHTKERSPLACPICKIQFKHQVSLDRHVRRNNVFKCSECDTKFCTQKSLLCHKIANHGHGKSHKCQFCNKVFTKASNLRNHVLVHPEAKDAKKFSCTCCGESFGMKWLLDRHWDAIHSDEKPYACHKCPREYKSQTELNKHLFNHTGILPMKCSMCKKRWPNKPRLVQHLIKFHKRPKEEAKQIADGDIIIEIKEEEEATNESDDSSDSDSTGSD